MTQISDKIAVWSPPVPPCLPVSLKENDYESEGRRFEFCRARPRRYAGEVTASRFHLVETFYCNRTATGALRGGTRRTHTTAGMPFIGPIKGNRVTRRYPPEDTSAAFTRQRSLVRTQHRPPTTGTYLQAEYRQARRAYRFTPRTGHHSQSLEEVGEVRPVPELLGEKPL